MAAPLFTALWRRASSCEDYLLRHALADTVTIPVTVRVRHPIAESAPNADVQWLAERNGKSDAIKYDEWNWNSQPRDNKKPVPDRQPGQFRIAVTVADAVSDSYEDSNTVAVSDVIEYPDAERFSDTNAQHDTDADTVCQCLPNKKLEPERDCLPDVITFPVAVK